MKIITTVGGPYIYKRGVLEDGTMTGRVRYTGQKEKELEAELLETVKTGRDDVESFLNSLGL